MVYSPGIVLIRDDNGEWLSPVEVDVLTSAAVNAGEIRRELEREERSRNEREVMEYWKKKGKAFAEVKSEDKKGEEVEAEENQENIIDSPDNGLGCGSDSQLKSTEEDDDQPQPETPPEVNQEPNSSNTIVHPLPLPTQLSQAPDPDPNSTYAAALENAEIKIEKTMYARISRILHLFQLHQTPHLILGSFGTGVFKNHIELVATIFADLLIKPGGKFKDVFQTVVFAILGKETVRVFSEVFSNVNKQAQREGTGKTSVIVDSFGSGNDDVKEGDEGKTDAAFHPLSFDGAHANTSSYPTSSAPADEASYAPSFDAAQADAAADAASFIATQASEAANAASSIAVEAGAAASAAASASPFEAAEADAAASAAYSNAAQACAAAYAAYSNAARAYAAAGQADEAALFRGSATAYAASSDAWRYSFMCAAADAASFRQSEATFHPFSFDAAEASGVSSSSDAADAAAYASSFDNAQPSAAASAFSHADAAAYFTASYNAAQASVAYPPSFDTTKANVVPYPTSLSASHSQADVGVQANPTAVDYHGIPEDAKLISTKDDEQVDFVAEATANAPITPKAIVVDDGKDIEMIETKSLPTRSSEAQSSNLNKKEDGDDESAPC